MPDPFLPIVGGFAGHELQPHQSTVINEAAGFIKDIH
jgi:hypothetical protein